MNRQYLSGLSTAAGDVEKSQSQAVSPASDCAWAANNG